MQRKKWSATASIYVATPATAVTFARAAGVTALACVCNSDAKLVHDGQQNHDNEETHKNLLQ